MRRNHLIGLAAIAAAIGAWCYVERDAARAMLAENAENGATRRPPGGKRGPQVVVNDACRNLCEPHCRKRWGDGSLVLLLREGCYRNCIDVACAVAR